MLFALALPVTLALIAAPEVDDLERSVQQEAGTAPEEAPRTYASFRVGAATSATRPELCLAVSPLEMVALEGCGTGGGFLHQEPGTDITHFRGKLRLTSLHVDTGSHDVSSVFVEPWIAAGFAELQVAGDTPGFSFEGASPGRVSTAGPDVGASLRGTVPLPAGFEIIGEVGVGLAFFAYAPLLVVPQDPLQPTASVNLGLGW